MSNIKVREEGYYLVKNGYSVELQIEYLKGKCIWDSQRERYEKIGDDDYEWIADEPLDLEWLADPIGEAVRVRIRSLEKEIKRYKGWYGDMDSLSR